ncbi:MAG: SsrA-binding protein [Flavobacteriaceae bacterium]|nr:SsrA-binding protein [Flavobacteriaceae bacterium]
MYKFLAFLNKIFLPSYTRRRLSLSKANKLQLAIVYWRYTITKKAL